MLHPMSLQACRNLVLLVQFVNYLAKSVNTFRYLGHPIKMKSTFAAEYGEDRDRLVRYSAELLSVSETFPCNVAGNLNM